MYHIIPHISSLTSSRIGLDICLECQTHSGASVPASWTSFVKLYKICTDLMREGILAWFWISYSLRNCSLFSVTWVLHSSIGVREFGASLGDLWRVDRHLEFFTCLIWEWLHPQDAEFSYLICFDRIPVLDASFFLRPVFPNPQGSWTLVNVVWLCGVLFLLSACIMVFGLWNVILKWYTCYFHNGSGNLFITISQEI